MSDYEKWSRPNIFVGNVRETPKSVDHSEVTAFRGELADALKLNFGKRHLGKAEKSAKAEFLRASTAGGFDREKLVVRAIKGDTSGLRRYCLEDLIQCYPEGDADKVTNHVPFVVKEPGIGGALRTFRGRVYYALTGRMRPNADHLAIKNGEMPLDQIKSKFDDGTGKFKIALDGSDVAITCKWKTLIDRPMDGMFFGTPAGATNRFSGQLFEDKCALPYCFRIYKQFALETWGDPVAVGKLNTAFAAAYVRVLEREKADLKKAIITLADA